MSPGHKKVIIQLHYNDLRVHDSPTLAYAHAKKNSDVTHFLPLYVFDERVMALQCIPGYEQASLKDGQARPVTVQGLGNAPRNYKEQPLVPEPRTRQGRFWKTGRHRVKFTTESVFDLKQRYRSLGGDLWVAAGVMEDVVREVVGALQEENDEGGFAVNEVWMQKEVSTEEVNFQRRLRETLEPLGTQLKLVDSKPMIQPQDLPFKVEDTPDVYTSFRKKVEGLGDDLFRDPEPKVPSNLKPAPRIPSSLQSTVHFISENLSSTSALLPYLIAPLVANPDLGDPAEPTPIPKTEAEWEAYKLPKDDPRSAFPFVGGETTALARLDDYLGQKSGGGEKAMSYKDTRNGLLGEGFSTKFSAWLANGTMSGRYAGWRIRKLMERLSDEGKLDKHVEGNVYWIQFELLWRDYFYFLSEKYSKRRSFESERNRKTRGLGPDEPVGNEAGVASTLFNLGGFQAVLNPKESAKTIGDWRSCDLANENDNARLFFEGKTGVPFLDAALREIAATGYMSNRMRQNVASYFAVDLYIDWRVGAEWFETYLSDYDVCSNWGNWQYQARDVGTDPRAARQFNPLKQANTYDIGDEYVKTWVPELNELDEAYVQTPWLLPADQKNKLDYPKQPISESPAWKKHYRSAGKHGNRNRPGTNDDKPNGGHGGKGKGGGKHQHGRRGGSKSNNNPE